MSYKKKRKEGGEALKFITELEELNTLKNIKVDYPTVEKAWEEILELRKYIEILRFSNTYKRSPGRPSKRTSVFFRSLDLPEEPSSLTKEDMADEIMLLEKTKKLYLKKTSKKYISDIKIITLMVNFREETKNIRFDKRKRVIKKIYNKYKHYRQVTGRLQQAVK